MKIDAKEYIIKLNTDELLHLAESVQSSIVYNLKTCWTLQQNEWQIHEQKKLKLLKTMYSALGRINEYEQIFKEAEGIFKKFNDKHTY